MKKTEAQRLREQRDRARKEKLDAALATTLEKRRADPYNIASWETGRGSKKSPAQLDAEIAEVLGTSSSARASHATKRPPKVKDPRVVHVEATTPAGYRWLRQSARGATVNPQGQGFAVTDEAAWAESLRAAGAREI